MQGVSAMLPLIMLSKVEETLAVDHSDCNGSKQKLYLCLNFDEEEINVSF